MFANLWFVPMLLISMLLMSMLLVSMLLVERSTLVDDRPTLVISPGAVDVKIIRRQPLETKAAGAHQRLGALVGGLNVRFDAMQAQHIEGMLGDEQQTLVHQTLAGVRGSSVVAEAGREESAANNGVEIDNASDMTVAVFADQEAGVIVAADAAQVVVVGSVTDGREYPRLVQPLAVAHQRQKLVAIAGQRAANRHALGRARLASLAQLLQPVRLRVHDGSNT